MFLANKLKDLLIWSGMPVLDMNSKLGRGNFMAARSSTTFGLLSKGWATSFPESSLTWLLWSEVTIQVRNSIRLPEELCMSSGKPTRHNKISSVLLLSTSMVFKTDQNWSCKVTIHYTCDTKGVIIAPIRATALQQPRPKARTTVG